MEVSGGPAPDAPTAALLARLQDVLEAGVNEAGAGGLASMLRAAAAAVDGTGEALACRIVPFVPGRRPEHEAAHPGLGSSEEVAVILAGDHDDPACVLFQALGSGAAQLDSRVAGASSIATYLAQTPDRAAARVLRQIMEEIGISES